MSSSVKPDSLSASFYKFIDFFCKRNFCRTSPFISMLFKLKANFPLPELNFTRERSIFEEALAWRGHSKTRVITASENGLFLLLIVTPPRSKQQQYHSALRVPDQHTGSIDIVKCLVYFVHRKRHQCAANKIISLKGVDPQRRLIML